MAYTEPNVLIYQILEPAAVATPREQPAHIAAPYAHLGRYSDSDEKSEIQLGFYDEDVDVCAAWPGIPAGGVIDESYTKLFIDDALLRYFTGASNIATVASTSDQVRASALAFKGNGSDYPLSDVFLDRDVQLGDVVRVRAVVDSEEYVLWSYVAGFDADAVAATRGTATLDANNVATQVNPATTHTQSDGDINCVEITAAVDTNYDGRPDGDINETYRILVVESSIDGDATTARLLVTSASGRDDQGEISPSAFGAATTIGTRGLTVTWDLAEDGCSSAAEADGLSANDFLVGQEWEVTCGQAFTRPTLTSGGTYTGTVDTTYVIEVTRGGAIGAVDPPQITCTTINGGDRSGPTDITGTGAFAVGTDGITIAFNGASLLQRDLYYIVVTAAKDGYIRTLKLGHNFPQAVIDNGATDVSLSLFIRKNVEVPRLREGFAPDVNWTQDSEEFCTKAGMIVYDDEWQDDGVNQPLEVFSAESMDYGRMYVEYRAWLPTFCNGVFTLETIGDLDTVIPGPLTPDNPLKYGVYWAKLASAGVPVRFTGICNPDDVESWTGALDYMENRRDIYGLVPVTRNAEVLAAWYGHITEQSSPTLNCRRVGWFSLDIPDTGVVVSAASSTDSEDVLAVVEDDADTAGSQYTIVRVPDGNSRFVTNGVRAGDIVRLLYTNDAFDRETWTEGVVDAVINQDTLRLVSSVGAPISTARRIEVWRNLNADDKVTAILAAKSFDDRRVQTVLPDEFTVGTTSVDGLYLCCALAGLASGVEPHQALTRYPVNGITSVPKMDQFKRSQLNRLADAGVWLVVEDKQSGTVLTRHALTSSSRDDANYREEAITRNLDNISMQSYDILTPYLGVANNVPATRQYIRAALDGLYQSMRATVTNALLGSQLSDLVELRVEPHAILKNNVVITTRMQLPYAINEIADYMII